MDFYQFLIAESHANCFQRFQELRPVFDRKGVLPAHFRGSALLYADRATKGARAAEFFSNVRYSLDRFHASVSNSNSVGFQHG